METTFRKYADHTSLRTEAKALSKREYQRRKRLGKIDAPFNEFCKMRNAKA